MTTETLPPCDELAERRLLGGVLRWPAVLDEARAAVTAESFYFDRHQKIWDVFLDLDRASRPIDLATVCDRARVREWAGEVTPAYLAELWDDEPTGANAGYHANIVRDMALRRALIHAAREIVRDAEAMVAPAEELVADAERKVFAIGANAHQARDSVRPAAEVMAEVMASIQARAEAGSALRGLATGYPDLDQKMGGLRGGELVLVGARPSLGKTALGLNLAYNAAVEGGAPVLFFSLEMKAVELGERLLALDTGVPMHAMAKARHLTPTDLDRLARSASSSGLGGAALYFDDCRDLTVSKIASTARRVVRKLGVQLVVIDYLQLIRAENPRDNRVQQVADQTRRLKLLAGELDVPVLLLSQLNRENERGDRQPKLSDFRESGSIEQDADRCLLLHRDADLDAEQEVWPVDVILAKQRNGPTGSVTLAFRRPVMRYENAARGPM